MVVEERMAAADWVVVAMYFVALITTGVVSSFYNRGSVGGYFLAGQNANWVLVGASLFASNIGSGHFIGLAGSAAKNGIAVSTFELHAVFTLWLLGWFFLPVYRATGVYTLPEYMFKRFGGSRIRVFLAVLSLILYVLTKISADLYSGAIFMSQALPGQASLYLWVIILVSVAAFFTITGGLTAVMWTDTIQTVIMLFGAVFLAVISFNEVGGYKEMKRKFPISVSDRSILHSADINYTYRDCGRPKTNWFTLMLPVDDGHLPWTGIIFGLTVSALWYWCTDQVIVQRALAAKNMLHAKMGCVLASYLKILPMWLIIFPGMIARILYRNEVACNDKETCIQVCGRDEGCTDIAYALLIVKLMPVGIKGLMISVVMSALISSLTSVFNSISTVFTIDVWRRIRIRASDIELMVTGRLVVVLCIVISIIWIPVVENATTLYDYIQTMTAVLGSTVCAAFVLAVFWKRTTERGTFVGLMLGTMSGLTRGIWQSAAFDGGKCSKDYVRSDRGVTDNFIKYVHFLHFGVLNYVLTTIVIVVVSLLEPAPPYKDYMGKTYFTRNCFVMHEELQEHMEETPQFLKNFIGEGPIEEKSFPMRILLWICGLENMLIKKKTSMNDAALAVPMVRGTTSTPVDIHLAVLPVEPVEPVVRRHSSLFGLVDDPTMVQPKQRVIQAEKTVLPKTTASDPVDVKKVTRKKSINCSIYEPEKMRFIMHANIGLAMAFISAYWAFYST